MRHGQKNIKLSEIVFLLILNFIFFDQKNGKTKDSGGKVSLEFRSLS